jgi:hypothetical protein
MIDQRCLTSAIARLSALTAGPSSSSDNSLLIIKTSNCRIIASIAHIVKGALGAGILGGHVAYMKAGYLYAIPLNILLGVYMGYCLYVSENCTNYLVVFRWLYITISLLTHCKATGLPYGSHIRRNYNPPRGPTAD